MHTNPDFCHDEIEFDEDRDFDDDCEGATDNPSIDEAHLDAEEPQFD